MTELLDMVDGEDRVMGVYPRSYFYKNHLCCFRTINCFLKNEKNELWIPQRTSYKKLYPLMLDASVGGHVQSMETYQESLTRI